MAINPITPITPISPVTAVTPVTGASGVQGTEKTGASFSDLLSEALGNAVETDVSNQINTNEVLSGVDTELHTAMIETQKAELSLNLAIQIRNKVVEAYTEVMRMQV